MAATPAHLEAHALLARIDGETEKAWHAFLRYAELGPERTVRRVVDVLGRPERYYKQLRKWSALNSWLARAAAYDAALLESSLAGREQERERVRQILCDAGDEVARRMLRIALNSDDQGRPLGVPWSTQLQAQLSVLALKGLVAPKRVELTGADGDPLGAPREDASPLSTTQLEQVRLALAGSGA